MRVPSRQADVEVNFLCTIGQWLFFKRGQDRAVGAGDCSQRRQIRLRLGIARGFAYSPRYFKTCFACPATLQRLTFDKLVSLQPCSGVGIYHYIHPIKQTIVPDINSRTSINNNP